MVVRWFPIAHSDGSAQGHKVRSFQHDSIFCSDGTW